MTVIAWDGKTLAADKCASFAGRNVTVCKLARLPDGIAAASGDGPTGCALLAWAGRGRDVADYPKAAEDDSATLMVIQNDGTILLYTKNPYPMVVEDRQVAIGCGREYALAAMYLGHDAAKGVEVASALDIYCGNGIDTLELIHDPR